MFLLILNLLLSSAHASFAADFYQKENFSLQVTDQSSSQIQVQLLKPKRSFLNLAKSQAKLPVLMVFGGFREAAKILDLLKPLMESEAKSSRPVMVATFDYPFAAPRKFKFPESLKYAPEVKKMTHEMIPSILKLRRELARRPDVDPDKIIIVGASFGAPFAIAAAAQDPEIHQVAIIHGFGDVPRTALAQLNRLPRPVAWLIAHVGWWYLNLPSPEESAQHLRADQKILMISAANDSFIPKESMESLWAAIEKSKASYKRMIMPGDHLRPGSEKLIEELIRLVLTWAV